MKFKSCTINWWNLRWVPYKCTVWAYCSTYYKDKFQSLNKTHLLKTDYIMFIALYLKMDALCDKLTVVLSQIKLTILAPQCTVANFFSNFRFWDSYGRKYHYFSGYQLPFQNKSKSAIKTTGGKTCKNSHCNLNSDFSSRVLYLWCGHSRWCQDMLETALIMFMQVQ